MTHQTDPSAAVTTRERLDAHLAALPNPDRAMALVDQLLAEERARYGTPVTSYPPLPPPDPGWARIKKMRTELETGFTTYEWAVGKVLCPAREKCPSGLRALFTPLKNGRLPMHRDTFSYACPGAHKKPPTPPIQLLTAARSDDTTGATP